MNREKYRITWIWRDRKNIVNNVVKFMNKIITDIKKGFKLFIVDIPLLVFFFFAIFVFLSSHMPILI